MKLTSTIVIATVAILTVVGVAGCTSGNTTATPTTTKTVTESAAPSPTATTPAATPPVATTPSATALPECATATLQGSITVKQAAASGRSLLNLILTDKGPKCTLQGWPGVSFVGTSNGTQIGDAATFDRTTAHPTVTLTSGRSASAVLTLVTAGAVVEQHCTVVHAGGFRIYPPGQTESLFIAYPVNACSEHTTSAQLLVVGALQEP